MPTSFFSSSTSTTSEHFSSNNMEPQKAVYLTSFGGGLVLSHKNVKNPSSIVCQFLDPNKDEQKWVVEYGEEEGVIALKSCANGEYLRANGGRNGSPAGTGEKQWWKMSWWLPVKHPNAFQLTSVEYPTVLLNHFQGQAYDNKLVHMWRFEQPWVHGFTWSFMDTDLAFQWPGKQNTHSKVSEGQLKDLEQREAALGEAQKQVTAQKAEQEKFDEQLRTREKELEELFKTKEEELDARFKTREELKQQTGENNKSEEYSDDPNKKLREKLDQEFASKEAVLNKQKEQNDRKEKDLSEREAQLGKSVGASGPSETELLKAENENLKLKLKISELEAEMSRLKNSSAKGSGPKVKVMPKQIPSTPKDSTAKTANMSKPRTNIDGAKADDEAGAIKFDCGHVVYPPPRKLRKKLVGMLYQ